MSKTVSPRWAFLMRYRNWLRNDNEVLVYGTNQDGTRTIGDAGVAVKHYGAKIGEWWGPTGRCYAIPIYSEGNRTVDDERKKELIAEFLSYARRNSSTIFRVCRLGSAYYDDLYKELFQQAPRNIILPTKYLTK